MTKKLKKVVKKYLKKHSDFIRNCSHWAIFIFASLAFATSIADVSAKQTMEILILNPELAEGSMLVTVWYLPTF
jgi:hypothetical protein